MTASDQRPQSGLLLPGFLAFSLLWMTLSAVAAMAVETTSPAAQSTPTPQATMLQPSTR